MTLPFSYVISIIIFRFPSVQICWIFKDVASRGHLLRNHDHPHHCLLVETTLPHSENLEIHPYRCNSKLRSWRKEFLTFWKIHLLVVMFFREASFQAIVYAYRIAHSRRISGPLINSDRHPHFVKDQQMEITHTTTATQSGPFFIKIVINNIC